VEPGAGLASRPDIAAPAFDLHKVEALDGSVEVTGHWQGVKGRRFIRPSLRPLGAAAGQRALADLEHKPWAARDGEPWVAVFPWDQPLDEVDGFELAVAPDLAVRIPVPGANPQDLGERPAIRTRQRPAVTHRRGRARQEPRPAETGAEEAEAIEKAERAAEAAQQAEQAAEAAERDRRLARAQLEAALATNERTIRERDDARALVRELEQREQELELRARELEQRVWDLERAQREARPDAADQLRSQLELVQGELDQARERLRQREARPAPVAPPAATRPAPAMLEPRRPPASPVTRLLVVIAFLTITLLVILIALGRIA